MSKIDRHFINDDCHDFDFIRNTHTEAHLIIKLDPTVPSSKVAALVMSGQLITSKILLPLCLKNTG